MKKLTPKYSEYLLRLLTDLWHDHGTAEVWTGNPHPQLFYVPFMPSVRNTWTSLKRNEFITFRNLKTAITIFLPLRPCSKWKQLAILTRERDFEKQMYLVIFISVCYFKINYRRTTAIAVCQIVLSFQNARTFTSFHSHKSCWSVSSDLQSVFFFKKRQPPPPLKKEGRKKTTKQIDAHLTEVFLPVPDGITFERTYSKVYTENSDIYQRINDSKISV